MAKKGKKSAEAFSGFKRDKKTLKAPITAVIENSPVPMDKSSWQDVQLPEYLWVALVFNGLSEEESFDRLRRIAAEWPSHSNLKNPAVQPGSHSAVAALPKTARKKLLRTIKAELGKGLLSPLCNLSNLPASDDWVSLFGEDESLDQWFALGDSIQQASQFQSKNATHICWFISLAGVASGQMTEPA
ncbi:MAG: hypothetical protein O3B13_25765, partial [Planctomycetota bacterium]|nr:hypothetical protein [Planctomycetota bacterium]